MGVSCQAQLLETVLRESFHVAKWTAGGSSHKVIRNELKITISKQDYKQLITKLLW